MTRRRVAELLGMPPNTPERALVDRIRLLQQVAELRGQIRAGLADPPTRVHPAARPFDEPDENDVGDVSDVVRATLPSRP